MQDPSGSSEMVAPLSEHIDKEEVPAETSTVESGTVVWTVGNVFASIGIFLLAGLAEISGGWLVWQTIRESKPWYYACAGSIILVGYGFIPTLQPIDNFGRVYAVYGGFFIILSYAWGWIFDGDAPDLGDWLGSTIALGGVMLALFWPRASPSSSPLDTASTNTSSHSTE